MKVTLCDRCGKRIEEKKTIGGYYFQEHMYKISESYFPEYEEKKIDLCLDCARKLYLWLTELKED